MSFKNFFRIICSTYANYIIMISQQTNSTYWSYEQLLTNVFGTNHFWKSSMWNTFPLSLGKLDFFYLCVRLDSKQNYLLLIGCLRLTMHWVGLKYAGLAKFARNNFFKFFKPGNLLQLTTVTTWNWVRVLKKTILFSETLKEFFKGVSNGLQNLNGFGK